tara:strand:+ start:4897 stop:5244 length:348 start_codon:yes stop_codon:yes gene_type:complete
MEAKALEERLSKAEPDFKGQKEGSKIGPSHFATEVGGGTEVRSAHYNTNNVPIEVEDVKAKKPKKENVDLESKNPTYPSTLAAHLTEGKGAPLKKSDDAVMEIRKSLDNLSRRLH